MAHDSDSHYDFYAPWPLLGKRFSAQLGEIRQNTEELHPIVRYSATYDKDLDNIKDSRLRGWEYGDTAKHNRFRTISDTDHQWKIQTNTGTEQHPFWQTALSISEDLSSSSFYIGSNIIVKTTGASSGITSGTIIFHRNDFYITRDSLGRPVINALDDVGGGSNVLLDVDDGHNEYLSINSLSFSDAGFYLSRGSSGQPVVNSLNIGSVGGNELATDDGFNQYSDISRVSFAGSGFYLSRGSSGQPVVNLLGIPLSTDDHGSLTGLTDDDHSQYLLVSGVRAATGDFTFDEDVDIAGLLTVTGISNLEGQVLANDGFSATGISNFFGNVDVYDRVKADHFIGGGFYFADNGGEAIPGIRVREVDGTPNVYPVKDLIVSNGTLTDNSDGSVTITTSGGGGGSVTFTDGVSLFTDDSLHFNRTSFYLTPDSSGNPVVNFKGKAYSTVQRGATWVRGAELEVDAADAPVVHVYIAEASIIRGVQVLTNGGPGDCVLDIWAAPYSQFPPTVANSITAAAQPFITTGTKYSSTALTGWTTAVPAGTIIAFQLYASSDFTLVTCTLTLEVA